MNVGYYSIDNTETNDNIPTTDYSTTYNVINRFQSVLSNPKIPISKNSIQWEDISNVVVDIKGNTYYLLKVDYKNTSYLKIIVVSVDGKILVQQDIDHEFKKLDLTQRNLLHLLGRDRNIVAVIINDNHQLYRFYYALHTSENNVSGLEIKPIQLNNIKREIKDSYIAIDTNSIPYEPRLSAQGSGFYALIQPTKDSSLPTGYPCLLNIQVNNAQVKENCHPVMNKDVYQFLPSLKAKSESEDGKSDVDNDIDFDFATDYNVFSGPLNATVEEPSVLNYLGSNVKIQRFDWSKPDFYYATDDGIGYYKRKKEALKSSVEWQIQSKDLPANYTSMNMEFIAYSGREKHLFTCMRENVQGENGHLAIIDTDDRKLYEDNSIPCTKGSLVLLADKSFVSTTKDGVNFYSYDSHFNIKKVKTIPAVAGSFVSAPVIFNHRLYANGNVFCNDTLSPDIFNGNVFQDVKGEGLFGGDSLLKPVVIGLGVLILLALLVSLLFITKRKKNGKGESIASNTTTAPTRKASDSYKENYTEEDEDYENDLHLNVGVRNNRYSHNTLNSKQSFGSKHTINSHISQRSLINKKKNGEPNDANDIVHSSNEALLNSQEELNNPHLNDVEDNNDEHRQNYLRNYPSHEPMGGYIQSISPIEEEIYQLSKKGSGQYTSNSDTNDSSEYHDVMDYSEYQDDYELYNNANTNKTNNTNNTTNGDNNNYSDNNKNYDIQIGNTSDYGYLKEINNTTLINSSSHQLLLSPSNTVEATFVATDKLSPAHKNLEESMNEIEIIPPSDIAYSRNGKTSSSTINDKNQNKSNGPEVKAGLVKTQNLPTPHPQQVVIVNEMLTTTGGDSDRLYEDASLRKTGTEKEIKETDSKSEKSEKSSRKSLSYLASLTNPFLYKLKMGHNKNENTSEKSSGNTPKQSYHSDSPNTIFSGKTVKASSTSTSNINSKSKESTNIEDDNPDLNLNGYQKTVNGENLKTPVESVHDDNQPEENDKRQSLQSLQSSSTISTVKDKFNKSSSGEETESSSNINDKLPPTVSGTVVGIVGASAIAGSSSAIIGNKDRYKGHKGNRKEEEDKENYVIPDFPDNNIKSVYKNPLLNKQSKSSLMSVDPLKIDSDTFKERPHLNDLSFNEDGIGIGNGPGNGIGIDIPPPPEFNPKKILTSDKSSDFSYRTSRSNNSNYSERLQDIKHQYRQFQNNLHNQNNKNSNESSDQTSFLSISNASSVSHRFEDLHLDQEPIVIPPLPASMKRNNNNNIFAFPNRSGSKSSTKTGSTSFYSASSDVFTGDKENASKRFNNILTDQLSAYTSSNHDELSDIVANTSISSYTDQSSNDNASNFSFHSCLPSATSTSSSRNVFGRKRDSDQFTNLSSPNTFYSIKSAQYTSQSLPSGVVPGGGNVTNGHGNGNGISSPAMSSPIMNHHDSIKSNISFQSAFEDKSFISNAASVSSQITNPFLRDSITSSISTSSYGSPLAQLNFNENDSFLSATESFHTIKTNNDHDPVIMNTTSTSLPHSSVLSRNTTATTTNNNAQQNFGDAISFKSATGSFHTIKTNDNNNNNNNTMGNSQFALQNDSDISSFVSATGSFHTVKSTNIPAPPKKEFQVTTSNPLVSIPGDDASSFMSAAESFHTVKNTTIPVPAAKEFEVVNSAGTHSSNANVVAQNFGDDTSSFMSAESFQTIKTNQTQATDATTTSTFKSALPNYNPFKN